MTPEQIEKWEMEAERHADTVVEANVAHPDWYPAFLTEFARLAAQDTWRCFHCDEVFTTRDSAAEHFGCTETNQPACTIDIAEYRAMEDRMRRYNEEDSELHREIHRLQAKHTTELMREEEIGYARGLRDGRATAAQEAKS